MEAEKYLLNKESIKVKIRLLEKKNRELRDKLYNITANMDANKVQSTGTQDNIAELVAQIVDNETDIINMKCEYEVEEIKTIKEIYGLKSGKHIQVLYYRYIDGMRIEQIAKMLNYEEKYTSRLHREALQEFEKNVMKLHKTT